MNNISMVSKRKYTAIEQQAAEWIGILDSDDITPDEFEIFLDWRDQSAQHQATFERMQATWNRVHHYDVHVPKALRSEHRRQNPVKKSMQHLREQLFNPRNWILPVAAATSLSLAVVVTLALLEGTFRDRQTQPLSHIVSKPQTYIAKRAETLKITLEDGSTLHLKALSKATVYFSQSIRRINLQHGEAYFDVARDLQRPFRVYAKNGLIEALGTRFGVAIDGQYDINVKLVKGVIKVSNQDKRQKFERVMTSPGHNLLIATQKPNENTESWLTTDVYNTSPEADIAWTQGRLIFRGTDLKTALNEINRHSQHTLVIKDKELESISMYASLDAGDWRGALSAIESSLAIRSESIDSQITHLFSQSKNKE